MGANDYQVGGKHYLSSYAHWDFVINCGLGYLEAQATRYLARWDKKGTPKEDLQKARHYVEKLIECIHKVRDARRPSEWIITEVSLFTGANVLTPDTQEAIRRIALWTVPIDLDWALDCINRLLSSPEAHGDTIHAIHAPYPAPVPATDSNKHAERPTWSGERKS